MSFPESFVWGAAAASYQIEGAAFEAGKGRSVWDMFAHRPGAVFQGDTGDAACDHVHRYVDDVALMGEMGLQAYRLSISWPRVLPSGTGTPNEAGLDFYDRLIDALLAAQITPYVTLFHWDYPYELYCRGGWLNPAAPDWFADYAALVVDRLGDRVAHWMPLNEPSVFTDMGHGTGVHAPGDRLGREQVLRIAHHALLAHGRAVQAIRARATIESKIGCANVGNIGIPVSDGEADINAARAWTFNEATVWNHAFWADPMLRGEYPAVVREGFGSDMPDIGPDDMATIQQPLDFYGFNAYQGTLVRAGEDGTPQTVPFPPGHAYTLFHWPLTPQVLGWGARYFYERYGLPICVTENGLSNPDWVSADGRVHDPQRIDFTRQYLLGYRQAAEVGVPLWGYFHWSVMDNFEWAEGYRHRFGLIHVDFETQARTLKDSAYWYRSVIETNGRVLDEVHGEPV